MLQCTAAYYVLSYCISSGSEDGLADRQTAALYKPAAIYDTYTVAAATATAI